MGSPARENQNEAERVVVVTGSSSGLGHAFATHFAAQPRTTVYALDVTPFPGATPENVHFYRLDVTDETELARFAAGLKDTPINLRACFSLLSFPFLLSHTLSGDIQSMA